MTHTTPHREELPVMTAHNDLIARVMHRHNIRNIDLAFESQIDDSAISRIVSGQRVVTPEVIRALYRLTQDPEIVSYLFGCKEFSLIKHIGSDLPKAQIECLTVRACAAVLSDTGTNTPTQDDGIKRISIIDEAITCLMSLRAKVIPATPSPEAKQRRTVIHTPHRLDVVA